MTILLLTQVDSSWNEWSTWSECTVTCGSGNSTRMRTCIEEQHGGVPCSELSGMDTDEQACNDNPCPGNMESKFAQVSLFLKMKVSNYDFFKTCKYTKYLFFVIFTTSGFLLE